MPSPTRQNPNGSLFEQTAPDAEGKLELNIRDFEVEAAEGELRLRLEEVERAITGLEEAKVVTQTMLETVMSV